MIKFQSSLVILALVYAFILTSAGCSSQPAAVANSTPASTGTNIQSSPAPAGQMLPVGSPASNGAPAPSGEPIDTSKYDEAINRLKKQADKPGSSDKDRLALAHAYLARADALQDARQYRVALGDYRRTLKYDPANADAAAKAENIVNIMKSMGREVPLEGQEPPPLPYKPSAGTTPAVAPSGAVANTPPLAKSH